MSRVVAALIVKALLGKVAERPEVTDLLCQYAEAVPGDGFFLSRIPGFLRPYVT
jgi:hypothetical protein